MSSKVMRKVYALFRMNFLIVVLLVVTAVAMFAYKHFLDDVLDINLADYGAEQGNVRGVEQVGQGLA